MSSEEKYLVEFCANNNCPNHTNCDLCMYEKGKQDALDKLLDTITNDFIYDSEIGGYLTVRHLEKLIKELKEQKNKRRNKNVKIWRMDRN